MKLFSGSSFSLIGDACSKCSYRFYDGNNFLPANLWETDFNGTIEKITLFCFANARWHTTSDSINQWVNLIAMRSVPFFMIIDSHIITSYESKCVYLFVSTNNNKQQRQFFGAIHKYSMFIQNNIQNEKENTKITVPKSLKNDDNTIFKNFLLIGKHASEMPIISTIEHWTSEQSLLTHHQCDAIVHEESRKVHHLTITIIWCKYSPNFNDEQLFILNLIFTFWIE